MTIGVRPMADGDTLVTARDCQSGELVAFRLLNVAGIQGGDASTLVHMAGGGGFWVDVPFGSLAALLAPSLDDSTHDNTPSPSPEDAAKASAERRRALLYRSAR